MMMNEIPGQLPDTKYCGQCCLAVLKGIPLDDAVKLIGHSKRTQSRDLLKHLSKASLKRGTPNGINKALCICRPAICECKGNWHWVVYMGNSLIYDPAYYYTNQTFVNVEIWETSTALKISSYYLFL